MRRHSRADKRRVQGARNYPGLDAGVLATARDAGISEEQLQRLSGLLVKPNRMEEKPRSQRAGGRQRTALSETEEDADEDEVELVPADEEAGVKEPVERAILQLTKLVSKMSEKESKKRSGLEEILDRVDTGGAPTLGGGTRAGEQRLPPTRNQGSFGEATRVDLQECRRLDGGGLPADPECPR